MAANRSAADRKRENYRLDYFHQSDLSTGHARPKKQPKINLPRVFARFQQLELELQKRIIRYAVTADYLLPAQNAITLMPGLVGQHMELIKLFSHSARYTKLTDEVFWVQNTVAASSLEQVTTMIDNAYKPLIKRLYIAYEPKMGAKYSKKAVTGMVGKLKGGLVELESLEYLAVAIVYEDAEARKQEIEDRDGPDELRIVLEAVGRLEVLEKVVLLENKGDDVAVGDVSESKGGDAAETVQELLRVEVGNGLVL